MGSLSDASPSTGGREGRVSGSRVVVVFVASAVAIAAAVILIAVLAVRANSDEGGRSGTSEPEAAARETVLDYVEALNARDATALLAVSTAQGLQSQLRASGPAEVPPRLAALTEADRMEDVRVTSVNVSGDRAVVTTRFQWQGQDQEAVYRLVRRDGRWLIDG